MKDIRTGPTTTEDYLFLAVLDAVYKVWPFVLPVFALEIAVCYVAGM